MWRTSMLMSIIPLPRRLKGPRSIRNGSVLSSGITTWLSTLLHLPLQPGLGGQCNEAEQCQQRRHRERGGRCWCSLLKHLDVQRHVLVRPWMWPETTFTAPNSPIARALHRITP